MTLASALHPAVPDVASKPRPKKAGASFFMRDLANKERPRHVGRGSPSSRSGRLIVDPLWLMEYLLRFLQSGVDRMASTAFECEQRRLSAKGWYARHKFHP